MLQLHPADLSAFVRDGLYTLVSSSLDSKSMGFPFDISWLRCHSRNQTQPKVKSFIANLFIYYYHNYYYIIIIILLPPGTLFFPPRRGCVFCVFFFWLVFVRG